MVGNRGSNFPSRCMMCQLPWSIIMLVLSFCYRFSSHICSQGILSTLWLPILVYGLSNIYAKSVLALDLWDNCFKSDKTSINFKYILIIGLTGICHSLVRFHVQWLNMWCDPTNFLCSLHDVKRNEQTQRNGSSWNVHVFCACLASFDHSGLINDLQIFCFWKILVCVQWSQMTRRNKLYGWGFTAAIEH